MEVVQMLLDNFKAKQKRGRMTAGRLATHRHRSDSDGLDERQAIPSGGTTTVFSFDGSGSSVGM